MVDAPGTPEVEDPPAAAEAKKKRTRLQAIAFFGGLGVAALVALLIVALVGGRLYLLSGPGRELVTSFVAGQKIGRYGRINVENVRGDLFDDFTIGRVTVTDAKGVWLEATEVRVDWSYLPLITRRFHADEISAGRVRVLRRPEVEPSTDPPRPMPLDIDIDSFRAEVELLEGFSKEYGRWRLSGNAAVPRTGAKEGTFAAVSLSRPGDFLNGRFTVGDKLSDLRLNLRAEEASGGPLAGAMGYSPDAPFSAVAVVTGAVVDARVRSGAFVPLRIVGRFGEDGSKLSGYVDFSRSDLLAPFAQRLGRTARFGVASVPDRDREGVHGVAWDFRADNISTQARGYLRLSDQAVPDGLDLRLTTPNLARLTGTSLGGGAALLGRYAGTPDDWTFDGQMSVLDAEVASWRAARLAGPVEVKVAGGRIDLDGRLSATGGSSAGLVGGLLGRSAYVELAATRDADGAVLLRRLDLTGEGLKVEGQGSRTIGGALAFRGRAEVTDVSRIRPGGGGAFGGPVTATAPDVGGQWRIGFDGRGRGLETGVIEIDRLLGPQPRLQASGLLDGDRVLIDAATLTGAEGSATTKGIVGFDGTMRLALAWQAEGPFGVGPVEIAGAMRGDGGLTGTFAQPRADLRAAFDRVEIGALELSEARMTLTFARGPGETDGRIAVTAGSPYGPARAVAAFALSDNRTRLTGLDLNAGGVVAQGDVTLSRGFPSSADLTFTARPGAFLRSGTLDGRVRLTDGAASESAVLNVSGRNVTFAGSALTIRTLEVRGAGSLSNLPFTAAVDVGGGTPVQFQGDGVYARADGAQTVTLNGDGRVREIAFSTRKPLVFAMAEDGRVVRADLAVGGGVLIGEYRSDARATFIQADLTSVELGSLMADLRGRATGTVSLRGTGADLSGSAQLNLQGVRSVDAPRDVSVDGVVNATLIDDRLRLVARARDEGAVEATADVTFPVVASASPLRLAIDRTRPLSGDVFAEGEIRPIWDLFMGGERTLSGRVEARARLGGSLNELRLTGRMDLSDGTFRDSSSGLRLEDLGLAVRFDDETALIETFAASDGDGGAVAGEGRLGLRQGSASSFRLQLSRFRVIDNELASARASGPLTVERRTDGNITLAGRLDVDEARIEPNLPGSNGIVQMDVVEVNRPGGAPDDDEETAAPQGPQIGLALQIRSPGGDVRVVGRGLNVELNVDAEVRGTLTRPILSGTARVVRGDYEFAGKRFVFDEDGRVILSTDPEQIRLNLAATRDDPALTATIRVTGTAARPDITLTSTPALPQDEILSQVLFGRSASQLSPVEAAQLASGVASLAGGGGFDVFGSLRELAGLDRLSFGAEASGLTVAGGRYISDDVYLEIIGGGEGGAAVSVEWQPRRNLAVQSKFGGQGEASLSIRWRRESGRTDGRRDRRPNRGQDRDGD
ncbi:MAG: translocation/assembly module TamB domain-containing protein [Alphaproteobacteria bacterium]|nr:translocation/assembly module TamB domain-containing protein [Alphaproteobacteria bacterium]MBU1524862.1 translocation/assembly module TamB domain-containing protein [Alphaproteobacteria bacterium]MBU2350155.1 translocation/assembly module TamB domain-containing protein [Alphaproteobacteria bacterium]MBU2381956.1 translocation/assembly module TamB domain-containing protein [Alphaproteobacteria bacterium]